MAKKVLVFRELPDDQLARLQAVHDVTVANPRIAAQRAAFEAALPAAQGMSGSAYPGDAALLDRAPKLEAIASVSVGVDNYALSELHARGIVLCHTPGVLDETVADSVFSILMATCRRVVELYEGRIVRDEVSGGYTEESTTEFGMRMRAEMGVSAEGHRHTNGHSLAR